MTAISCRHLSCGYQGKSVLEGIDLDIEPGMVTALLGPNGSGKSTLLKTITGEIAPLGGELLICDRQTGSLAPRDRAKLVAFVPSEERTEFPFLVREVVSMGRIPYSEGLFDNANDLAITEEAMAMAQCKHVADQAIGNVSAGEQQRALLARALAQRTPILLLDEPTSHLDPGHQVTFAVLMRSLAKQGIAVLAALHDLNLAAQLGDRGVLLSQGKIVCDGAINSVLCSAELDRAYATDFEKLTGSDGKPRLSPRFPPA